MKLLTFEDGIIKLGGEEVPGILTGLSVAGKVRFDEKKVDGQSGKRKTPQGFEDADIKADLTLTTDSESTCYEKLEILSGMFRKVDAKANPQVLTVANRHLQARNVRQVVFSRLDSAEDDQSDEISAALGFVEHSPPIVRTEKQQAKTPTPQEMTEQKAKGTADPKKYNVKLIDTDDDL